MLARNANNLRKWFSTLNHYTILGVREDSSFAQIRKNYLQLIKTNHPDSQTGNHKKFIQLQRAFETLSNPVKRKIYDKSIGIQIPSWDISELNAAKPTFENDEFDRILADKENKKTNQAFNFKARYRQQEYKQDKQKYLAASLIFPFSGFVFFWLLWETSQMVLLNYKGETKYEEKQSTKGKDLSVFVAQTR